VRRGDSSVAPNPDSILPALLSLIQALCTYLFHLILVMIASASACLCCMCLIVVCSDDDCGYRSVIVYYVCVIVLCRLPCLSHLYQYVSFCSYVVSPRSVSGSCVECTLLSDGVYS